jgi:hypothetical protein
MAFSTSPEEWHQKASVSGELDQIHAAARSAADHADKWFSGTAHLLDDDTRSRAERVVKMAKRGMMVDTEVNDQMRNVAGSLYPDWEPDTSPRLNVPDHLGPQFMPRP